MFVLIDVAKLRDCWLEEAQALADHDQKGASIAALDRAIERARVPTDELQTHVLRFTHVGVHEANTRAAAGCLAEALRRAVGGVPKQGRPGIPLCFPQDCALLGCTKSTCRQCQNNNEKRCLGSFDGEPHK
jgi:hypothetical protein